MNRWTAVCRGGWLALLPWLATASAMADDRHLLLVSGLGGEAYYSGLFQRWSHNLLDIAHQRLALARGRSIYLAEDAAAAGADGRAGRDEVLRALSDIARASAPGDRVLVVLVGHGTAQGGDVRFNLPGPDLSPADLDAALDGLAGRRLAVVVTTPSSGPYTTALAEPGRIVISATASGAEFQHTRFGGFFIEALGGEDADADKDRRVSLLEAFDYARRRVQQAYRSEQRLQPEHALLEDNGDGQGSREPGAGPGADGALAARFGFEPPAAAEPGADPAQQGRLAALQVSARRLVDAVERLRRDRRLISEQAYLERLEGLLVELALNRRAWREAGGS